MKSKRLLSLILSALIFADTIAMNVPPENRSLMSAFQSLPSSNNSKTQSEALTLPTPPPVDTQTLLSKSADEPQKAESPFSPLDNSIFTLPLDREKTLAAPAKQNPKSPTQLKTAAKTGSQDSAQTKEQRAKALKAEQEKDQLVRFYFEDATLENLVRYIEELYKIKFLVDDDFTPAIPNGGVLKGNKITFKTNKPLSRVDAWDLFLKFLDIAGLSAVETNVTGFYRITTVTNANKEVLPTFFNTKVETLPDNNLKVRYVFFVKNSPLSTIQQIVSQLASPTAMVDTFPDLNAVIITDKGINIRSLMKVVQEFDKEMPEAMSILKLQKADAQDVAQLYSDLTKTENPQGVARFLGQRAQPDSIYFPANARIIVEPRTNALILLGPAKALKKIEEFISQYIDVDLTMPYSPLYIYEVQYLNSNSLVTILNQVISFGQGSNAAAFGGVRGGNEYFGPVNITAEPTGNRIIIKAEERDYKKIISLIKQLDVIQPEVAIEVLIVNVSSNDNKNIGSQFHNKTPGSPAKNVNFQTSGFPTTGGASGPVINATTGSLLGNLIGLASTGTTPNGATYLTLGNQAAGVWGIFQTLKSFSDTSIIANPFLMATNNYAAQVSVGTSRQIQTGSIISSQGPTASYDTLPANLTVQITPQISVDSSVQMSINVNLTDFSDTTNLASGNTFTKQVVTSVSVKDRQIVALGGIVKTQVTDVETKVPVLGDIPVLGWFFKNKQKTTTESKILIFISPRILTLKKGDTAQYYTLNKSEECADMINEMYPASERKDPINRAFFGAGQDENDSLEKFLDRDPELREIEKSITDKTTREQRKAARKAAWTEKTPSTPRTGRFKKNQQQQAKTADTTIIPPQKIQQPAQTDLKKTESRGGRFKKSKVGS